MVFEINRFLAIGVTGDRVIDGKYVYIILRPGKRESFGRPNLVD